MTEQKFVKSALVVDDDPSICEIVAEMLEGDGFEVEKVHAGEEALARIAEKFFPVIVTDIRMPGMSGIDLLVCVKRHWEETQVVIMTSHATMDSAVTALKGGAFDFIQKPFQSLDVISNTVKKAYEKSALLMERNQLVDALSQRNKKLVQMNQAVREMAIKDELTGLLNYRYLKEALAQEVEKSKRYQRPLSVMFIDIDHFKNLNDEFGHQFGNHVLKEIAGLLVNTLRQSDIVARYGGEEFFVIMPETNRDICQLVAEKIRSKVEVHHFEDKVTGCNSHVTISAGVASFHEKQTPGVDELILIADKAVYKAKSQGRNRVCIFG